MHISYSSTFFRTSLSSSVRDGSSSSGTLLSGFSGSLDSSTCSSTFNCFVRRAINCDFNPLELSERQSSSLRRSFTYKVTKKEIMHVNDSKLKCASNATSTFLFGSLFLTAFCLEPYLHWFRVKFSPVSRSAIVLRLIVIFLFFLLDRKIIKKERGRRRKRGGIANSQRTTYGFREILSWSVQEARSHLSLIVLS